jgi:hypothetical protein
MAVPTITQFPNIKKSFFSFFNKTFVKEIHSSKNTGTEIGMTIFFLL